MNWRILSPKKFFRPLPARRPLSPKPLVKGGSMDKAELFCDGDRGSFWHSGAYGQPGDWYGVDYGMPIPVRSVEVLMGPQ